MLVSMSTQDVGTMSPSLDALSLEFVRFARSIRLETLDIGCGDGIAIVARRRAHS